jgi:hypothetical protein
MPYRKKTAHRRAVRSSLTVRPALEVLESRLVPYSVSGNAWPHPSLITLSFVPDGTVLATSGDGNLTSNLFSTFNAKFGSAATWENQILQAANEWAQQTNINFAVVSDNGATAGTGSSQQGDPNMGDIRIGGYNFGSGNNNIATANMPPSANNYSIAGDIDFNTGKTFNIGSAYDLRTVALHEFGHALGLNHSTTYSAVMYSVYTTTKQALTRDDINGIQKIYSNSAARSADGDAPNSFATASDITSTIDPTTLTALLTGQSLNSTPSTTDVDYFTFTAPSATTDTLTVTVQSAGLSLLTPVLTVYAADQQTVLGTASAPGQYGATVSVTVTGVTAGQQFYVQVSGGETTALGSGAYALTLNFGSGDSPTVPLPNTQTTNGNPRHAGGGVPDSTTATSDTEAHDTFGPAATANTTSANSASAVPLLQVRPASAEETTTIVANGNAAAPVGVVVPVVVVPTVVSQAVSFPVDAGGGGSVSEPAEGDAALLMKPDAVPPPAPASDASAAAAVPRTVRWPMLAAACFVQRDLPDASRDMVPATLASSSEPSQALGDGVVGSNAPSPLSVAFLFAIGLQAIPGAAFTTQKQRQPPLRLRS